MMEQIDSGHIPFPSSASCISGGAGGLVSFAADSGYVSTLDVSIGRALGLNSAPTMSLFPTSLDFNTISHCWLQYFNILIIAHNKTIVLYDALNKFKVLRRISVIFDVYSLSATLARLPKTAVDLNGSSLGNNYNEKNVQIDDHIGLLLCSGGAFGIVLHLFSMAEILSERKDTVSSQLFRLPDQIPFPLLSLFQGHRTNIVEFSPSGRYLISVGADGVIRLLSVRSLIQNFFQLRSVHVQGARKDLRESTAAMIREAHSRAKAGESQGLNNNTRNKISHIQLPPTWGTVPILSSVQPVASTTVVTSRVLSVSMSADDCVFSCSLASNEILIFQRLDSFCCALPHFSNGVFSASMETPVHVCVSHPPNTLPLVAQAALKGANYQEYHRSLHAAKISSFDALPAHFPQFWPLSAIVSGTGASRPGCIPLIKANEPLFNVYNSFTIPFILTPSEIGPVSTPSGDAQTTKPSYNADIKMALLESRMNLNVDPPISTPSISLTSVSAEDPLSPSAGGVQPGRIDRSNSNSSMLGSSPFPKEKYTFNHVLRTAEDFVADLESDYVFTVEADVMRRIRPQVDTETLLNPISKEGGEPTLSSGSVPFIPEYLQTSKPRRSVLFCEPYSVSEGGNSVSASSSSFDTIDNSRTAHSSDNAKGSFSEQELAHYHTGAGGLGENAYPGPMFVRLVSGYSREGAGGLVTALVAVSSTSKTIFSVLLKSGGFLNDFGRPVPPSPVSQTNLNVISGLVGRRYSSDPLPLNPLTSPISLSRSSSLVSPSNPTATTALYANNVPKTSLKKILEGIRANPIPRFSNNFHSLSRSSNLKRLRDESLAESPAPISRNATPSLLGSVSSFINDVDPPISNDVRRPPLISTSDSLPPHFETSQSSNSMEVSDTDNVSISLPVPKKPVPIHSSSANSAFLSSIKGDSAFNAVSPILSKLSSINEGTFHSAFKYSNLTFFNISVSPLFALPWKCSFSGICEVSEPSILPDQNNAPVLTFSTGNESGVDSLSSLPFTSGGFSSVSNGQQVPSRLLFSPSRQGSALPQQNPQSLSSDQWKSPSSSRKAVSNSRSGAWGSESPMNNTDSSPAPFHITRRQSFEKISSVDLTSSPVLVIADEVGNLLTLDCAPQDWIDASIPMSWRILDAPAVGTHISLSSALSEILKYSVVPSSG